MKRQNLLLFALLFLFSLESFAGKGDVKRFPVANIPDSLKTDAHAVIREDTQLFEVISLGKAKNTYRHAITILNGKGARYSTVYLRYTEGSELISGLSASVYDRYGNEVDVLKKKDVSDISDYDGSIASDIRYKKFSFNKSSYPYTIYYEYSISENNMMFYPVWYGQSATNVAVQHSSYQVVIPIGMKLHYKENNLAKGVKKSFDGTKETYYWEVSNLKAEVSEPHSNYFKDVYPHVMTRPDKFRTAGYSGNFDTWGNMGIWQNQLNQGRTTLPEETITKIKEIVKDVPSKREQVKKVYEYLQQNTRYVSIQLGIGGWQPFPADFVDKNGYGDCKALSNYTYSALSAIGIPSYYTLVKAGKGKNIDKTFPSSQFNHVFLCVPLEQDTVWLECTSQTNPFNYLGSFTSDRDVLLCMPEGGKLVHTPAYKKEDNLMIRTASVTIDAGGNATAKMKEYTTSEQHDNIYGIIFENKEKQKKYLYKYFDIPSFTINEFQVNWEKSDKPSFAIEADVSIPNCASKSGKRLFIKPNLLSKWTSVPKQTTERKSSIALSMAFSDMDTITYNIPSNYHIEYLPKPVQFSNEFGSYEAKAEFKDGKLIYTRKVTMEKGEFPKESYENYVAFMKKVVKADRAKVVFVDKT